MMKIDGSAIKMILSSQFWRMAILWPLTLLYCYARLNFDSIFRRRPLPNPQFRCGLVSNSTGADFKRPICIITGASSGLGLAAARVLAGEGFHVVLAGRCAESLHERIQEIKQELKDAHLTAFQISILLFNFL